MTVAIKRVEVIGIDLVRFMAASSVIVWHFAGKPFLTPTTSTLYPLMPVRGPTIPAGAEFSWFGWIGVQVFFVISGAVIAWSATRNTGKGFFIGRVARLWPAMIISATICSALSFVFWHTSIKRVIIRYVCSLIFFPTGPWFSGQIWTLPVEIVFYIIIWSLVATKRIEWLERLSWVLGCISLIYWMVTTIIVDIPWSHYLNFLLLTHGCYFATGIVLAKVTTEGVTRGRVMLLVICFAGAFREIDVRSAAELDGSIYSYNAMIPCLAWAFAVASIWASMQWRSAIARRFNAHIAFFKLLGALTYPLYLVHYQTGGPIFAALYSRGWPIWCALVPAYAVALIFAFLIAKWMEPPLSKIIDRGLRRVLSLSPKTGEASLTPLIK